MSVDEPRPGSVPRGVAITDQGQDGRLRPAARRLRVGARQHGDAVRVPAPWTDSVPRHLRPARPTTTAWEMVLRVSANQDEDAHRATDDYCATGTSCSLIDAVNADVTLGGVVGSFVVKGA